MLRSVDHRGRNAPFGTPPRTDPGVRHSRTGLLALTIRYFRTRQHLRGRHHVLICPVAVHYAGHPNAALTRPILSACGPIASAFIAPIPLPSPLDTGCMCTAPLADLAVASHRRRTCSDYYESACRAVVAQHEGGADSPDLRPICSTPTRRFAYPGSRQGGAGASHALASRTRFGISHVSLVACHAPCPHCCRGKRCRRVGLRSATQSYNSGVPLTPAGVPTREAVFCRPGRYGLPVRSPRHPPHLLLLRS